MEGLVDPAMYDSKEVIVVQYNTAVVWSLANMTLRVYTGFQVADQVFLDAPYLEYGFYTKATLNPGLLYA